MLVKIKRRCEVKMKGLLSPTISIPNTVFGFITRCQRGISMTVHNHLGAVLAVPAGERDPVRKTHISCKFRLVTSGQAGECDISDLSVTYLPQQQSCLFCLSWLITSLFAIFWKHDNFAQQTTIIIGRETILHCSTFT